ncbi:MAG: sigma-70 family RNA polymerase sigma factor [Planctomycetes bacterium]|nr:sigma-70 family RNA polymerase sigma factor [Planctomycetota bacterium]
MNDPDPTTGASLADFAQLGQLLEEHRPKLLAMLERRIDPGLAVRLDPEEILSDAYVLARRKWAKFRDQERMTPYAWLYRIARDCLIEAWRKQTRAGRDLRRAIPFPEQTSLQLGLGLIHSGTSPSAALARKELQERVQNVMASLKPPDQEILVMRHFDELSYQEIAAILEIETNTAQQRYHRALGRFSDLWHG